MTEEKKQRIEYIKHLNTLSTGSVVIIATFLKDIFKDPKKEIIVVIALGGFLVSVVSAVIVYTSEILNPYDRKVRFLNILDFFFTYTMWIGFLCGVILMGIFSMLNLLL